MTDEGAGIDGTEVGVVAARVMADLEELAAAAELGENPVVVAALVAVEVSWHDAAEDRYLSTVLARVTGDRNVVALGLVARAKQALLDPDDA